MYALNFMSKIWWYDMSENPLSGLKIDYWYKILPVLGAIGLIISLTTNVKIFDNETVALISIGIIFIGIGEWINHPLKERVHVSMRYKITDYNRSNTFWGNLWDVLGLLIIASALYCYFYL